MTVYKWVIIGEHNVCLTQEQHRLEANRRKVGTTHVLMVGQLLRDVVLHQMLSGFGIAATIPIMIQTRSVGMDGQVLTKKVVPWEEKFGEDQLPVEAHPHDPTYLQSFMTTLCVLWEPG